MKPLNKVSTSGTTPEINMGYKYIGCAFSGKRGGIVAQFIACCIDLKCSRDAI